MGRKSITKERKQDPEKKQQWVRELMPYFHRNGLKNFSMNEVATILDKSKATVYKYFESREEILELANTFVITEMMGFEKHLTNRDIEYPDRFLAAIEHILGIIDAISVRYLVDLKELYPELWDKVTQLQNYAISALEEYYVIGIQAGYFNNIEPRVLVQTDRLFFYSMTDPMFLLKNGLTIKEALEAYFKMKFYGLVKK